MNDQQGLGPSPVVEMRGITIEFPGVKALDGVDLTLRAGEVHALMGENGAGKSTLIKILTGVYQHSAGTVRVAGKDVHFGSTADSQAAGISTVYQEVNLCANLSVAENIMLGNEVRRGPFIDWAATRRAAREHLARLGLDLDPRSSLDSHSLAVQQLCAIARGMVVRPRVLILDEPTSSLDKAEVAELFRVVRALRDEGVAILFVSHFLDQVYEISDRMTILRNGQLVSEHRTSELSRLDLVQAMVGRAGEILADVSERAARVAAAEHDRTSPVLTAQGLGRPGSAAPFDLDLFKGEIVGVAGLLGSGRTELARLLFGADKPAEGTLSVQGDTRSPTPLVSLRRGVVYSSEDRKKEGIIGDLTVRENIALALQAGRGPLRRIPAKELDEVVERYLAALQIRPANPDALVRNLSGGNQQKVLLARWLATQPKVLILDEPTRGIDVGAKAEIQKLVTELADQGLSVMFISSELEEVVRISERILVLRDRHVAGEIHNGPDVTVDSVLETIAGRAS
ncbi:sugar ABC transporter ATP-binding protein [Antribacter gilvus]|uniref:sugar ABC transporter ATP-binding protein n=1 Tax=Antribacter gilvus TaxID=2304675 RepID=UPI000F7A135C|nr:sugar ABC transporter ATP-binding protein [Antribacter gilvus]